MRETIHTRNGVTEGAVRNPNDWITEDQFYTGHRLCVKAFGRLNSYPKWEPQYPPIEDDNLWKSKLILSQSEAPEAKKKEAKLGR